MPPVNTTDEQTLAQLARQFDVEYPVEEPEENSQVALESTTWQGSEDSSSEEESDLVLQDFAQEKTKVDWKTSSKTRLYIIGGGFTLFALLLLSMLNFQMPTLEPQTVVQERKKQTEGVAFAQDGDFAAEAAYASQDKAFEDLENQQSLATKAKEKVATPSPQRSPAPSSPVVRRSVTPPAPPTSPAAPPRRSVVNIPRSLTRSTVPPVQPSPKPRISPPKKSPTISVPPRPVAPPVAPPVVSVAPKIDPMEQWMIASMSGVSNSEVDTVSSNPSRRQSSFISSVNESSDSSVFGVQIPLGTKMKGALATPISFSANIDTPQQVLIEVEPSDILPNGGQLMASYEPAASSQSTKVVVSLQAVSLIVDGYEIPLNSSGILISGKKGKGIIAKQQKSGGGVEQVLGTIALGGLREGMGLINRPNSSSITTGQFGSSATSTFDDPDILAGVGFGAADKSLDIIQSQMGEPTLDGVWSVKPGKTLEIHFVQETTI